MLVFRAGDVLPGTYGVQSEGNLRIVRHLSRISGIKVTNYPARIHRMDGSGFGGGLLDG